VSADHPHFASNEPISDAELPAGTIITLTKRFQITGPLGEGGMGKVFKAFDPYMNRYVALKVMKADVPETQQRRFRLEARLCGSFNHPNLVRVLDVGTTREHNLFWFAMEFLEGRDIRGAIRGGRRVPLHVLCEIFREVLEALNYAHRRGIVHRDIKPANIFVCRDPRDPEYRPVKVLDFGVAKDLSDEKPEEGNLILGDPRYMAPEQTRSNLPLDHRADLYALGITFFEAMTGHHPFEDLFSHDPKVLLKAQRERPPGLPSAHLDGQFEAAARAAIDAFFAKACSKDPLQRFADARAMLRGLADLRAFAP